MSAKVQSANAEKNPARPSDDTRHSVDPPEPGARKGSPEPLENDDQHQSVKKKREPNAIIGEVVCPFHKRAPVQADVKKNVNGKLYYDCPRCGLVMPARAYWQEWMLQHATIFDDRTRREATSRGTAQRPVEPTKRKWTERLL